MGGSDEFLCELLDTPGQNDVPYRDEIHHNGSYKKYHHGHPAEEGHLPGEQATRTTYTLSSNFSVRTIMMLATLC